MNCERFKTVVDDLAREQNRSVVMDAGERASALAHAAECDVCALNLEEGRSLTTSLRTLADEMNSFGASPQLEERVLAAFRQRDNVRIFAGRVQRQGRYPRYWVAAVAAVLLIVFGIFVVRLAVLSRSRPQLAVGESPKTTDSSRVQPETFNPTLSVVPAKPLPTIDKPRRNRNGYSTASPPARASSGKYTNAASNAGNLAANAKTNQASNDLTNEIATDFFPLGSGSAPALQEGGQLVRVELPRAAMARFGLPINMERAGQRVKADVLLGADGLAQAIRFVH